jgi:hypothetical protein
VVRLSIAVVAFLALAAVGLAVSGPAYALGPGQACVFEEPDGGTLSGNSLGHVGWGYEIDNSGTYVYGATENPNGKTDVFKSDGQPWGSWHRQGSFSQMLSDFQTQPAWGTWTNGNADNVGHATIQYTRYKCVTVDQSAVGMANAAVNQVENIGYPNDYAGAGDDPGHMYSGIGWNCMDHAFYILRKYNADLPNVLNGSTVFPDGWFASIPGGPQSVNGHNYVVTGADAQGLAVQTAPHVGNVDHYVGNKTPLVVVCQTKNGDQVDGAVQYGQPFRTWDQLFDGTYVYDWYMNTPVVGTNGYSPGIVPCVGG